MCSGVSLWTSLPSNPRKIDSFGRFKGKINRFYDTFIVDGVLEKLEFCSGMSSKMNVARRYEGQKKLLISKYVPLYFSFNLCYIKVKKTTVDVYSGVTNYIGIFVEKLSGMKNRNSNAYVQLRTLPHR